MPDHLRERVERAIARTYRHCRRLVAAARDSLDRGDARGALEVLSLVAEQRNGVADRRLALRLGRTVAVGEGGARHAVQVVSC